LLYQSQRRYGEESALKGKREVAGRKKEQNLHGDWSTKRKGSKKDFSLHGGKGGEPSWACSGGHNRPGMKRGGGKYRHKGGKGATRDQSVARGLG